MRETVLKNYQETFDERGDSYDEAMRLFPEARQHEFGAILELAQLRPGELVCDFPSGGGYIGNYIGPDIDLTLLEPSTTFYELCARNAKGRALLTKENVIPFNRGHFDKIISLAGVHHNPDQPALFAECARALKPGGAYCVADVWAGSGVDGFLNVFVDRHSKDGHKGVFFDDSTASAVAATGLSVEFAQRIRYPWVFMSKEEMARFCHMLFRIDGASPTMVLDAIQKYLGYRINRDGSVHMNWELYFIRAVKPV